MPARYQNAMKWALYALLFLFTILLQDSILGRVQLLGAGFCLCPLVTAAVAAEEGAENGGLFALISATFWALSGATDGGSFILTMTVLAIVVGYLFRTLLNHRWWAVAVTNLASLLFCLLLPYLVRIYLQELTLKSLLPMLTQCLLALPFACGIAWLCMQIGKVGQNRG